MFTSAQLERWVRQAIEAIANEAPPLKFDSIGERALCFRLGLHLNPLLPRGAMLDAEYNYDLSAADAKRVPNLGRLAELATRLGKTETEARLVTPDFIIHLRTHEERENFAVIEVKMANASELQSEYAKEKIKSIQSEFGYPIGMLITLARDRANFARNCVIQFAPFD